MGKRHQSAPDLGLLTALCRRHVLPTVGSAVLPEPYVPFIPANWNGILVTAESQNLSQKNAEYRDWLLKQSQTKRIRRLYEREPIAIAPWNDGTIPIALQASMSARPEDTAVMNAVPWSMRGDGRKNANPDKALIVHSISFWKDLLTAVRPRILLVCGRPGRKIFEAVGDMVPGMKTHFACSPSNTFLSRVSGLFREHDLLAQFPEVRKVKKTCPHYFTKASSQQDLLCLPCDERGAWRAAYTARLTSLLLPTLPFPPSLG